MRFPTAVLLTVFALLPLGGAAAERLDKEACEALKAEQAALVEAGAKTDMERGPEWAKANLAPDRLKRIARLLEVDEGLAFRCPQPRLPPVEVEAKSAPAAPASKKADEAEGAKPAGAEQRRAPVTRKAAEPAQAGTAAKPKRAAAVKEGASADAAKAEDVTAPAPSVKPAPPKRKAQKPVANDAYSPPPGTGSTLKIPGDADAVPWKKE